MIFIRIFPEQVARGKMLSQNSFTIRRLRLPTISVSRNHCKSIVCATPNAIQIKTLHKISTSEVLDSTAPESRGRRFESQPACLCCLFVPRRVRQSLPDEQYPRDGKEP